MKEIKKIIIEKALNSELYYHLDEDSVNNSRNGYSSKTIQTEASKIELSTSRDRNSSFEPIIVKKGQRKVSILDDQILALYAREMSMRDIASTFEEIYGVDRYISFVNISCNRERNGKYPRVAKSSIRHSIYYNIFRLYSD